MAPDYGFLSDLLPDDQVSFGDSDRALHAGDRGTAETDEVEPDVVVWPESTDDVAAVLAAADERGIPVTPYAAGTSLEGNARPSFGGISLDFMRMNDVLEVRPDDLQVDVEPGVIGFDVNEAVESHGLFFPPLPSSGEISTIGGMIANDSSGMGTVKYGEIHDWVLELEVVLADGRVATLGSTAKKTSAGYNLMDLVVGSEGTLAVVTRATLELAGLPEQIKGGRAVFPTLDDAAAAVSDAIRSGVDVAKMELIDEFAAERINAYSDSGLPDSPMVYLEFHANHGIDDEIAYCEAVFAAHDASRFEIAADEEMDALWDARRNIGDVFRDFDEDLEGVQAGDVTVPISKLPEIIRFAKDLGEAHGVPIPCFGHAGDGNVHYSVRVDPEDPERVDLGKRLYGEIVDRAIELGGTATGEHGVGRGKREFLVREHGEVGVDLMRRVKWAFDPNDTLNPGKIFPETIGGGRVRVDPPKPGRDG